MLRDRWDALIRASQMLACELCAQSIRYDFRFALFVLGPDPGLGKYRGGNGRPSFPSKLLYSLAAGTISAEIVEHQSSPSHDSLPPRPF